MPGSLATVPHPADCCHLTNETIASLKFLRLKQRKLYWVGAFRNNRSATFCLHYGCAVWNGLCAHPATSEYATCSREMSSRITHLT